MRATACARSRPSASARFRGKRRPVAEKQRVPLLAELSKRDAYIEVARRELLHERTKVRLSALRLREPHLTRWLELGEGIAACAPSQLHRPSLPSLAAKPPGAWTNRGRDGPPSSLAARSRRTSTLRARSRPESGCSERKSRVACPALPEVRKRVASGAIGCHGVKRAMHPRRRLASTRGRRRRKHRIQIDLLRGDPLRSSPPPQRASGAGGGGGHAVGSCSSGVT
ncbi:hypothetical protein BH09MYX1_BH09MYX1_23350 [soil metagenome]